jgi:hypothetical protein
MAATRRSVDYGEVLTAMRLHFMEDTKGEAFEARVGEGDTQEAFEARVDNNRGAPPRTPLDTSNFIASIVIKKVIGRWSARNPSLPRSAQLHILHVFDGLHVT